MSRGFPRTTMMLKQQKYSYYHHTYDTLNSVCVCKCVCVCCVCQCIHASDNVYLHVCFWTSSCPVVSSCDMSLCSSHVSSRSVPSGSRPRWMSRLSTWFLPQWEHGELYVLWRPGQVENRRWRQDVREWLQVWVHISSLQFHFGCGQTIVLPLTLKLCVVWWLPMILNNRFVIWVRFYFSVQF